MPFYSLEYLSIFAVGTLRTEAFGHIVDAGKVVARGECDGRNGNVGQTKGAMAALAVEMYMLIVVGIVAIVAVTELIAYTIATIFDDMHQVVLTEEGKGTEDTRLVNRQDLIFQLGERQRTLGIGQRLYYHDTIGCGFYAMLTEQRLAFFLT
jgi:hypothetical protein